MSFQSDSNNSKLVEVIAAVIERDGRFLVCRRPAGKRHGGLWEFPGGKVETGESFYQAAQRELFEELEMEVATLGERLYAFREAGSSFNINFIRVSAAGEPVLHEHSEYKWVSRLHLLDLDLAPADYTFAEYICSLRDNADVQVEFDKEPEDD